MQYFLIMHTFILGTGFMQDKAQKTAQNLFI